MTSRSTIFFSTHNCSASCNEPVKSPSNESVLRFYTLPYRQHCLRKGWFLCILVVSKICYHNYNRYSKTKPISESINSPSFVYALQMLDMCTLSDAADFNFEIKFLPHSLQHIRIQVPTAYSILSFTWIKLCGKGGA